MNAPAPHTDDHGEPLPAAVFARRAEDLWDASVLARGPWDPRAQHGGAPCALFVHIAEQAMAEPGWQLGRLTVELIRPVPLGELRTRCATEPARSTARVAIDLLSGDKLVARAQVLMLRQTEVPLPGDVPLWSPDRLLPPPSECHEPLLIGGLPRGVSFYGTTMDTLNAQGDPSRPGPGSAWFRTAMPMVEGHQNSPAMRAVAAADFGNGLSWVLPAERYLFTNADISVHLFRPPMGEWVGLQSQTQMDASGAGIAMSRLFDERGSIGIAAQTLVLRER
ncbi:thioesterase family protein [Variovorax dokdonensis]|uniref:Thioesterase family protein n=1 Tax=Variovorax dokdonensis TaxID=344883 RepID=A0ABT7N640_9BURK|nr:thioesterase family protein [Variovorax dokdonensis]MDM0043387.1 thioesterase family protein [Variovorax dokdonensis]